MTDPHSDVSAALEVLFSRFAAPLRRAGRRHGLAEHDVEELLQDVRIRLWRALETGEKISGVTASYVYRAARSAAIDLIRRRRGWRESSLSAMDDGEEPVIGSRTTPTQLDVVSRQDVVQQLDAAIDTLAESRAVVVRMYLTGYPREEIGTLLGWSEAKTRNLLYRGLADLRTRLGDVGIGPESAT